MKDGERHADRQSQIDGDSARQRLCERTETARDEKDKTTERNRKRTEQQRWTQG